MRLELTLSQIVGDEVLQNAQHMTDPVLSDLEDPDGSEKDCILVIDSEEENADGQKLLIQEKSTKERKLLKRENSAKEIEANDNDDTQTDLEEDWKVERKRQEALEKKRTQNVLVSELFNGSPPREGGARSDAEVKKKCNKKPRKFLSLIHI